ncbi:MAG: AI-2E family transporter [Lachnospiraceae bacterium]|nr:AI-2E family transporter [Lachnospiraceae bacterium]
MKDRKFEKYVYWGITAVLVIAAAILMVFLLLEMKTVMGFIDKLLAILSPITIGAVLAFLVTPIFNLARKYTNKCLEHAPKHAKKFSWLGKTVGTVASLLFIAIVVVSLCYLVIPQLYASILGIVDNMSIYVQNISNWLADVFENNPELESEVLAVYEQVVARFQRWASTNLIPSLENLENLQNLEKIVGSVSSGLMGLVNLAKNLLIGLIVMVYLLNIKETLAAQGKRIIYAFFPLRAANEIVEEFRYIHRVFSGFIIGKIIDSLIIGILCFILMKIMKLPFVLLVSVIVGVTNIIPFFGPFIGAIPSAVLVFLISPMQCLYFVGLIIVLQQFDGNILGPKILGNSTGLSSFWVLFSILLFGGLFGFVGMIIAVPMTAVIFDLFAKLQYHKLRQKNLSPDTRDYEELKRIDEESGKYLS